MALRGKLINTVASLGLAKTGTVQPLPQLGLGALAPKPPAPAPAPVAAQAPATPQPFAFTPDAQYLATLAQTQFQRQQQLSELETQGRTQHADVDEAIRRLLARVSDDRSQITAGANRQGILFGGHHAKRLADYQAQVTRSEGDQRLALQRGDDARAAVRQALLEGAPLEEAAMRAEAVERQVARDQEAAAANMLAAPPAAAAAAAKPKGPVVVKSGPQVKSRPNRHRRRRHGRR